ncbi:succinate dehydrogenase cytochrome b subunit [Glycomyces sp. TRM65418]|uniref:succinate dehydrogenase cytochrome b subunit n=1 Tax=Glycomyces sp. TRM65418 TaxID=2867006 RepID=UPI001CE6EAE2|nr:succinate dehydrogenase cytochrome b subunit [Glycomyces sp. TRM65418]MCC3763212.1 succinate dehydrogenase cytochrome b subunit [Glycomyces sp. TRM65418]QZD57216.1 succinate dehydrogenase cytochrome b subunit [Glycomyces sp. TRM65418]
MSTDLQTRTAAQPGERARAPQGPWRSNIGLKIIMAVSGILLVLFIIAHMAGNLHVFEGREEMNAYAAGLRSFGEPLLPHESFLWIMRIGLIAAALAHIWSAVVLTRRAMVARPVRYASRKPARGESRHAVATMRWGAIVIVLFVVWHLLDLTWRTVNPVKDIHDAYGAVLATFSPERWPVTVFYLLALVALGFHLRHGIWSAVQTISGPNTKWRGRTQAISLAVAVVVVAGFAIVPLAVTFELVS